MAPPGYVAVLVIELHFPYAGSLKAKRQELSSIKAQLRTRLGVAVSETGHQDLWQRGTLTAALTGGSMHRLLEACDEVERWVLARCPEGASVERLVVSVQDLQGWNVGAEGRMRGARMRRVDEAMRAVLSDAIATDLKDPRVGFVTVTGVKTSPDLRHARVYVSVLGTEPERDATIDGLRSAHGFLQRRLASELTLKHTPSLSFEYDDTVDKGMRITQLLDEETPGEH